MSSEHIASEVWLPTGKFKNEKAVTHLMQQASDTLEYGRTELLESLSARERLWKHDLDYPLDFLDCPEDTTEYVEEYTEEYVRSAFFQRLSYDDQVRASRALSSEDIQWRGGYQQDTNGLWDEYTHSIEVRGGELSRFVLSGLFGAELLKENKKLNHLASRFEENLLKRAILVGSVSLAASKGVVRTYDEVGRYTADTDSSRIHTHIGGDMHGDFMSLRYSQLIGEVRDNATGFDHAFAPAYDLARIKAYHSVEPRITEALLEYLVVHKGENPKKLRSRLLQRVVQQDARMEHRFGAFGDFDTQDGFHSALAIHQMVHTKKHGGEPRTLLASLVTAPRAEHRLEMHAKEGGVHFLTTNTAHRGVDYMVPAEEIEDYIVNLACAVGGRVTPRAHLPVIDALDGRRPDNGVPMNPFLPPQ